MYTFTHNAITGEMTIYAGKVLIATITMSGQSTLQDGGNIKDAIRTVARDVTPALDLSIASVTQQKLNSMM